MLRNSHLITPGQHTTENMKVLCNVCGPKKCYTSFYFFLKHVNYSDYNPKVRYLHALKC